ncbi:Trypanosome variant surface glycoprotein (A-type)/Trypanosome variant surface glycoprotein C-terminal domain containing protein, putative [Trypanosoma equiperdum]|uniref:Trypanosome variant surface glycoprotein (A-type)/Trypanosome variant surface glycoprotein C-terminal domain containing protein, putative n=1 Tax=Trypanosoma equiperdum TaxID=5694 RepID=A0A1G4I271_TRYEQ|nr:Trypanosome variant surface glycoprotein (A-type)/Trypanosome variant surface glycoprotein C-terminal domain containing protein, putative [Trypanosoma equiperdum]
MTGTVTGVVCLLALTLAGQRCDAAAGNPISAGSFKALCQFSAKLKSWSEYAIYTVKTELDQATKDSVFIQKVAIAETVTTDKDTKQALGLLRAYVEATLATRASTRESTLRAAVQAAAAAALAAGRTQEALALFMQATKKDGQYMYCVKPSSGDRPPNAVLNPTLWDATCAEPHINLEGHSSKPDNAVKHGFKKVQEPLATVTEDASGNKKCLLTASTNGGLLDTEAEDAADDSKRLFANGLIKVTIANGNVALTDTEALQGINTKTHYDASLFKAAGEKATELSNAAQTNNVNIVEAAYEAINNEDFKKKLHSKILKTNGTTTDQSKLFNRLVGENSEKFKSTLWKAVEQTTVVIASDTTPTKKQLKEISDDKAGLNDLAEAAKLISARPIEGCKETAPTTTPTASSSEEDCPKRGEDQCTGKCEWDKKKETCKAKEEQEQQKKKEDTATGQVAEPGCARHKDKTACEADKTGDKQNCAWRKGKEGEPEPEKEMCLNGSFLLNNQFALSVVSAAFMSFVEFNKS